MEHCKRPMGHHRKMKEQSKSETRTMGQSGMSRKEQSTNERSTMGHAGPCSTEQPGLPGEHGQVRFQSREMNVLRTRGHRRLGKVGRTNGMVVRRMKMVHRTRWMVPRHHATNVLRRKMSRCFRVPAALPSLCAVDGDPRGGLRKIDVLG